MPNTMEIINKFYAELCEKLKKADDNLTFDSTDENFDSLWENAALLSVKVDVIKELMQRIEEAKNET